MRRTRLALLLVVIFGSAGPGMNQTLGPEIEPIRLEPILGQKSSDLVREGDTLLDLAFRNGYGYDAVARINPGVDPWLPSPGTIVKLLSETIRPTGESVGLLINIPEMRLFDFTVGDPPAIFAAAVGDIEDQTPIGDFVVRDKRTDPVWNVPSSIRDEKPGLPRAVDAGPNNPLGSRWMRIGWTAYGIHGTNNPWSVGREATHGCVRLQEQDIKRLFERIPESTPPRIVYEPFKWGTDGENIVFEAYPDLYQHKSDPLASALTPVREQGLLDFVEIEKVWDALEAARGTPVTVERLPARPSP